MAVRVGCVGCAATLAPARPPRFRNRVIEWRRRGERGHACGGNAGGALARPAIRALLSPSVPPSPHPRAPPPLSSLLALDRLRRQVAQAQRRLERRADAREVRLQRRRHPRRPPTPPPRPPAARLSRRRSVAKEDSRRLTEGRPRPPLRARLRQTPVREAIFRKKGSVEAACEKAGENSVAGGLERWAFDHHHRCPSLSRRPHGRVPRAGARR